MATRPDALELALVDKDLLLKLLKHPPPPPTPIAPPPDADLTQMVTTDRAMGNLLKSQTMTPRSKRDAYNELLQVKNLHAQRYADDNVFKNTTTTLHNPPPTVKREPASTPNPPSGDGGLEVLRTADESGTVGLLKKELTEDQAERARALVKHLAQQDPEKIAWDSRGNLSIYGHPLPGTNIGELVVQLSRNRVADKTPDLLVRLLKELDVPAQLITNRKVQSSIRSAEKSKKKGKPNKYNVRDLYGRFVSSTSAKHIQSPFGGASRPPITPATPKSPYPSKWEKISD